MTKKITISALANAVNIVIGMMPAFFVIPYIAKNFGNNGVAHWNLFLAYISIYLLIADYGFNDDASKKILSDDKNIIKIVNSKIITTFAAVVIIIGVCAMNYSEGINPFCVTFAVISYAFNPIYYYQAKNKAEIPLVVNSLTVFAYTAAFLIFGNFTLEQIMYLFAARVAVMNMILWHILIKEAKFDKKDFFDVALGAVSIELKERFARFLQSISASFLNSGYIILASTELDKNLFAQYTMIHKLVFILLMFVISYCQTAMLVINKTRTEIFTIVMAGIIYFAASESILKIFGIDVNDVKPLLLNLLGAIFFILMGLTTLFYFKLLHDGNLRIKEINIFNVMMVGVIILIFALFKIPYYLVLWIPVLYSSLYLLVVLKIYKKIR